MTEPERILTEKLELGTAVSRLRTIALRNNISRFDKEHIYRLTDYVLEREPEIKEAVK